MLSWIGLKRGQLVLLLAVLLLLALGSLALAQAGTPTMWWTVDGGGGTVSGTIGQPEAGGYSSDETYAVRGGFWGAATQTAGDVLYLPLLQR